MTEQQAKDHLVQILHSFTIGSTLHLLPEQVSFRLDFTAWLATRTTRDRAVIADLMAGERTLDVSERHRLSPGRVSQLRREFMDDWFAFNEPVEAGSEGGAW